MSIHSRMTHTFEAWEKDSEADTWLQTHRGLKGSLQLLTPDGARRESATGGVVEPDVTHIVRMGTEASSYALGGRRLRDRVGGAEYEIRVARMRERPRPGNLKVSVAHVTAATQKA